MVTRRGLGLKNFAFKNKILVTNGHCGTLISLLLMSKRMSSLINIDFKNFRMTILGIGKMGTALTKILNGKVGYLALVDINKIKLERLKDELLDTHGTTKVTSFLSTNNNISELKKIFATSHLIICTTSNLRRIIKNEDMPQNVIIIDDSRPEAISRDLADKTKVVLEEEIGDVSQRDRQP